MCNTHCVSRGELCVLRMVLPNLLSDYLNIIVDKYEYSLRDKTISNYESVAFFNASKRLITCLVNELLVTSSLVKISKNCDHSDDSFWVVLHNKSTTNFKIWIPIIHKITEKNINYDIASGTVLFLDPRDIGQIILFSEIRNQSTHCELVTEIKQIFGMVTDVECKFGIPEIISGIDNSIQHQILAYKESRKFIPLWRPPIEYEQAITVGHPTHPMNKSRVSVHQMKVNTALYDFKNTKICFYKVPKAFMNIYGNYEDIIQGVAKKFNIFYNLDTEIIVPVHELQKDVINDYFNTMQLQETISTSALSQCSLRSVNINSIDDYTFKLPLGVIVGSIMRTISHSLAHDATAVGKVIRKIIGNNKHLTFLNELGSIIVKHDDFNVSQHFACIIRENVSVKLSDSSETAIVCAYLTEMSDDEYNITKLFDLKTQVDKEKFSDVYAKLLIDSFFDFVYEHGFTFEAHQQNVLLKVKKNSEHGFELTGFLVRDIGDGIIVHQETLNSKIGIKVSVLDDNNSVILADSLEDVYSLCYHTLFHCHLQSIFRSLGTHDNGSGWNVVREHLKTKKKFLASERCVNFFFAKMVPYKCFMKMKLKDFGNERDYCKYTAVPNLINFIQI